MAVLRGQRQGPASCPSAARDGLPVRPYQYDLVAGPAGLLYRDGDDRHAGRADRASKRSVALPDDLPIGPAHDPGHLAPVRPGHLFGQEGAVAGEGYGLRGREAGDWPAGVIEVEYVEVGGDRRGRTTPRGRRGVPRPRGGRRRPGPPPPPRTARRPEGS